MKVSRALLFIVLIALSSQADTNSFHGKITIRKNQGSPSTVNTSLNVVPALYSRQLANIKGKQIKIELSEPEGACTYISNQFNIPQKSYTPYFYLINGSDGECGYKKKVEMAKLNFANGVIILHNPNTDYNNLKYLSSRDNGFIILLLTSEASFNLQNYKKFEGDLSISEQKEESQMNMTRVELWVSSLNAKSYQMLSWWRESLSEIKSLKKHACWSPRFAIVGCSNYISDFRICTNEQISSCGCSGAFCSPQLHKKSTSILVQEDVRHYLINKNSSEKFLSYAQQFSQNCFEGYSKSLMSSDCATAVMNKLNIDSNQINKKITNFFEMCAKQDELFGHFILDRSKFFQIGHYPALTIDHQTVQFNNKKQMQKILCKKLGLDNEQGCITIVESRSVLMTLITWLFYAFIIFTLIGVGAMVVLFFRNKLRKEMNKQLKMQVSTAVEHYFTLSESK